MMSKEVVEGTQHMCQLEVWPNLLSDSETVQGTEAECKSQQKRESDEESQQLRSSPTPHRGGVQTLAA